MNPSLNLSMILLIGTTVGYFPQKDLCNVYQQLRSNKDGATP